MKTCTRCGEAKALTEFTTDQRKPGGHGSHCKICDSAASSARRERKLREDPTYKDRELASRRAAGKRYREAHPEAARIWSLRGGVADRIRRSGGIYVEHVDPLVVLELHDGVCGICGEDVDPFDYEVDHIDPIADGGEHSYANTQPAHLRCNRAKGNRARVKEAA